MIAVVNFIIMIVAGVLMSVLYVISVSPAQLEKKIGERAYKLCGMLRTISMIFLLIVIINYVIYKFYPIQLPFPSTFPWPYWVSLVIAAIIGIPSMLLMILGILDAGAEATAPSKQHTMYRGIYDKIRHPQAAGELPLWFSIGFLIHSPHMVLFSIIWIPVWYWWCLAEEKDLLIRYGNAYKEYMKHTGRFFPKRNSE